MRSQLDHAAQLRDAKRGLVHLEMLKAILAPINLAQSNLIRHGPAPLRQHPFALTARLSPASLDSLGPSCMLAGVCARRHGILAHLHVLVSPV